MPRTVPIGFSGLDPYWAKANFITVICPATAGAVAVDSKPISNNTGVHQGQMVGFKCNALKCTNAITFTLKIKDRDGDVIYTSGSMNRNAITLTMSLNIPIAEKEIVTITPSGNPGVSSGAISITFTQSNQRITRGSGNFQTNGFQVGDVIMTDAVLNPGPFVLTDVQVLYLVVASGIVDEGPVTKIVSTPLIVRSTLYYNPDADQIAGGYR